MPNPKRTRKEPTVSFSIRCPVSIEAAAFETAQRLNLERNGFVVAAIEEKVERERRRAAKTAA